jgi:ATP-binding cassette, subfamily B, bacterial
MERCPLYRRLLSEDTGAEEEQEPAAAAPAVIRKPRLEPAAPSVLSRDMRERVAMLPPLRDVPDIDEARETTPDPTFSLRRFLMPYRRPLAFGLFLVVLDALAGVAGPYLSRDGIDKGVLTGSYRALWVAVALYLIIALADVGVAVAETMVTGRTGERLMYALRIKVWAQLQRLSIDFYDREMAGRIMTRMTTDVSAFSSLLQDGLIGAVASLFTFAGVAVAMAAMNFELTLVAATVLVPLVIATSVFRRLSAAPYSDARDRIAVVNAGLQESISGVRESQAFVQEDRRQSEYEHLTSQYVDARLAAQRLISTYFPFVELLSDLAAVAVLAVGYHLVRTGSLTAGELIAFILYLNLFFSPIQQLSEVFDDWQQARVSIGRIGDLMAFPIGTPPAAEPLDQGRLRGAIELRSVRFGYPGVADEALSGISLAIAPGETIALVGETGAGKSSVVKLLARFYDPDSGCVLVDGHDLRTLDLGAYRRRLGYVPQESFLFRGTIRANIAYGRPSATETEVEAAARSVGADEFIAGLPGGLDYEIGERGASLSAGQRQLLCLARAELVDPAILLLDEATANLDLATEARVANAMRSVARGRTTVVIAHRLETARHADRIIVMAGGRIVEDGPHDELLRCHGPYASLWQAAA